ncbi:MAG: TetR/AcrR family transcriptional regulator [OM182 bacterium]|nr:MAG: TetR/AcrR family transcriptional regulator [OM182 bacterium]
MQGSKAQPSQIRLLEAASELLMREGIGGFRVDEVAKVAGCNKRLIYHYFTNKDGLGRAVLWAQVILLSTLDPVQSRFPPLSQRALRFLKDFFRVPAQLQHTLSLQPSESSLRRAAVIIVRELLAVSNHRLPLDEALWQALSSSLMVIASPIPSASKTKVSIHSSAPKERLSIRAELRPRHS